MPSFGGLYEEIEDPEDVKKDIAKSKIKYDSKGNLVDVRHQADIEGYQAWQAGNRQLNREMHEFEQMQAYYESKKLEAPYKTLGAFRRARRAQAQSYKDNRKEWSEKKEFSQKPLTKQDESSIVKEQIDKSQTDGLPPVVVSDKQFGKKNKRHMKEFDLDVSNADDREIYRQMIFSFRKHYDEVRIGDWAGQPEEVLFYIKGDDVLICKQNGDYITLFKGGISNARIKNARKR